MSIFMKPGYYFAVLLLAVACVALTVTLIPMTLVNQQLQVHLQTRQQAFNQGIFGMV